MPGRMTRSAPQSPFELPEVRAVVRATYLSCQNAGKAQKFTPARVSSGESRFKSFATCVRYTKTVLSQCPIESEEGASSSRRENAMPKAPLINWGALDESRFHA